MPKKRKINETEEIALPLVKCDVCGNLTTRGLHQIRLKMVRKGFLKKNKFGKWVRIPPIMKRKDVYLCTNCIAQGKKWPGKRP